MLFFLSGALALGYQTLWSKILLDFIGVSAYSYATVLASFMGGLALGSWLLGKKADSSRSPLKLYAYLELGIGLYAILFPSFMHALSGQYAHWITFSSEQAGATFRLWTKVLLSGILLLPPAALMGGTYPALLRHTTRMQKQIGPYASEFYAVNCFGAVAGTLLMTFVMMPSLGMSLSMAVLALGNVFVSVAALGLSWFNSLTSHPAAENTSSVPAASLLAPAKVRLVLILILVEGLLVFCYEIAWTRYFGLVLGSSTYSFAVMLAAFISGMALGSSWLARRKSRIGTPLVFFGWTQVWVGLLVLLPLPFYPYLPWVFGKLGDLLSANANAFYVYELAKLLLCYAIMLLPTVLIGMSLPLAIQGASRSLKSLGQDIGRLYAWNTAGNVLGAIFSGLVLLPLLGMEWLIRLTAAGSCVVGIGAVLAFSDERSPALRRKIYFSHAALLCILLYQFLSGSWDTRWFTLMPARRATRNLSFSEAKQLVSVQTTLLFRDDPAAHIMVVEYPDRVKERGLFVNGKPDASTSEDMITQILLGQLPLLLHPQSNDVLIIGLASGVTGGSVLTHPIQRADAVELVRAMPEATNLFRSWNHDPLSDKRFHVIADDARTYVAFTRQQYDVIISEPSNPWTAGTGSLFSSDFYQTARRALRSDGLYVQWLQGYEMSDNTFAAVVRSFRSAFPYVYAFQGASSDVLLIGRSRPLTPDWKEMELRFSRPQVHQDLERVHVGGVGALLALQRFSPGTVNYLAALSERENTDDNRLVEYDSPRDLFQGLRPTWPERLDERLIASPALFWSQYHQSFPEQTDAKQTLQLLTANRVASPSVILGFQLAFFHANPASAGELGLSAPFLLASLSPAEMAERIAFCLKQHQATVAASILDSIAPSILLESAISKPLALFWLAQSKQWLALSSKATRFMEFSLELQMASGQTDTASLELSNWIRSSSPPPANWAIARAAQWNQRELLATAIDAYEQGEPTLFLQRLRAFSQ